MSPYKWFQNLPSGSRSRGDVGFKRTSLVVQENNYIHAEFASGLFGFVDDVEFVFSKDVPVIHVRSASRTGYYDFGVNRRRIEGLPQRLAQATRDIQ